MTDCPLTVIERGQVAEGAYTIVRCSLCGAETAWLGASRVRLDCRVFNALRANHD
jgi:hypothetical protein